MKGDWILLGATGLALLAVPLTVLAATGAALPQVQTPPAVHTPGSMSTMESQWETTPIPGGQPTSGSAMATVGAGSDAESAPVQPPQSESQPGASQSAQEQSGTDKEPAQKEPVDKTPVETYQADIKGFKILNLSTGKVEEVPIKTYLRGAIAAEMPASFHLEALKAQGVAALTYALYHHQSQLQNPDPALLGADFSADPQNRKGYMTEKTAKKFYGDNWQYNWNKVCEAADEAIQYLVLYQNQPIAAAYHAISNGTTEAAENIWEGPLPCLVAVDSSGDILAKDYRTTATLTQSQIKTLLKDTDVELLPNADTWFTIEERSPSGYVTQVRVGNQTMTGNQLRNLLGLRSSSFQIERQGKDFLFYVCGYGHGAGLSQNGADHMARQGSSFVEILEHYYYGGNVTKVEFGNGALPQR